MHSSSRTVIIRVAEGESADRKVLLGFASAKTLSELSFADVLDEERETGYQRRFSPAHSLNFRRYIQRPGSTTIPLTFNLRPPSSGLSAGWKVVSSRSGTRLVIERSAGKVLSQVDCQHRLGKIGDLDVSLPFMCFVGLSKREELEIFSVINSKAKGIRGSLLDYHAAQMAEDLAQERPELLIALQLNAAEDSPWYRRLDLGGIPTVGMTRKASLRLMQQAAKRFLSESRATISGASSEVVAQVVQDFWSAVAAVLPEAWKDTRRHYLTKGVGVYALMGLLADLWTEAGGDPSRMTQAYFEAALSSFAPDFDWSTHGPLKGLGGVTGAQEAHKKLRAARRLTARMAQPTLLAAPTRRRTTSKNATVHG
jgi:DGQHR domain-containing protein